MQRKDFFTRAKHNEGTRVYLLDAAGNKTDAWILVRGLDSDAYRAARDVVNRTMARLAAVVRATGADATLTGETKAEHDAAELAARVALVAAWSFDEPCTVQAVTELLVEAPYISDQIFYAANDRDRFLEQQLPSFTNGQNTSSAQPSQLPQEQAAHSPIP